MCFAEAECRSQLRISQNRRVAERELPSWWLFWGRSAVAIFLDLVQFEGCGVQGGVPVGSPEV